MTSQQIKYYKVGGCVRDEILGIKAKDVDYSVEAPSFEEMRLDILRRVTKPEDLFIADEKHFTIRAKIPGLGAADFVLCRKDGVYSDGRRPDDVQVGTLQDDLARRDFTMNAIAVGEDGVIHDPFGGQDDIKFKLIRCVGSTYRLREDSLRMIRAVRFSITKGFIIDPAIEQCLCDNVMLGLLDNISVERIREELYKCFQHDTRKTLNTLMLVYPGLGAKIFGCKEIWLNPTLRYI